MVSTVRKSVSAVFFCKDRIFIVKRQNYLKAFPGYLSFPGGKLEKDETYEEALKREIKEELSVDIENLDYQDIFSFGMAETPHFVHPRFLNNFIGIELSQEVDFSLDMNEMEWGRWLRPSEAIELFEQAKVLMVHPIETLLRELGRKFEKKEYALQLECEESETLARISPFGGVVQILVPSMTPPPNLRTNCFLLGDDEQVIVDPAPKGEENYQKLVKTLEEYGPFKAIFLTHHHRDHHDQVGRLQRDLELDIWMSEDTRTRLEKKYGEGDSIDFSRVRHLKEGDVVGKWRKQDIFVFEVPGHDRGQLALANKEMDWFIVGDLIQAFGTVVISEPEGDMAEYFATLERVIRLSPKQIIPSHGIALGGTHRIQKTLEHRKQREKQLLELLEKGLTEDEILNKVYKGLVPDALLPFAKRNIESHIKKLRKEGRW